MLRKHLLCPDQSATGGLKASRIAAFLDPRYTSLEHLDADTRKQVIKDCKQAAYLLALRGEAKEVQEAGLHISRTDELDENPLERVIATAQRKAKKEEKSKGKGKKRKLQVQKSDESDFGAKHMRAFASRTAAASLRSRQIAAEGPAEIAKRIRKQVEDDVKAWADDMRQVDVPPLVFWRQSVAHGEASPHLVRLARQVS